MPIGDDAFPVDPVDVLGNGFLSPSMIKGSSPATIAEGASRIPPERAYVLAYYRTRRRTTLKLLSSSQPSWDQAGQSRKMALLLAWKVTTAMCGSDGKAAHPNRSPTVRIYAATTCSTANRQPRSSRCSTSSASSSARSRSSIACTASIWFRRLELRSSRRPSGLSARTATSADPVSDAVLGAQLELVGLGDRLAQPSETRIATRIRCRFPFATRTCLLAA